MKTNNLNLIPCLKSLPYIFEYNHKLLQIDAARNPICNIGLDGSNLTISFLSLNRSSLSIKLLESINECMPYFKGEVLIMDNGSSPEELWNIKNYISETKLKCRLIELGSNYGVGGARNKTVKYVSTEWLMCLDNDIYFISNPLIDIQNDLSLLGCHFMSLPLLNPDRETIFAHGGHLYVSIEDGVPFLGAGSACEQVKINENSYNGFLSTFLYGGSCIFRVDTFSSLGGYDENMFIGFEDTELSLRIFQAGLKVGSSSCFALVHDLPMPMNDSDFDYEKKRFSHDIVKKSAEYLKAKHGFTVWSDNASIWLAQRRKELGLQTDEVMVSSGNEVSENAPQTNLDSVDTNDSSKPHIALVIDTYDWAFGNISRQLEKHLSNRFRFTIIPMDIVDNIDQVFVMGSDCDIFHFFWREHLALIGSPYYRSYAEILVGSYEKFHQRFIEPKILSTSVYDHLFLEEEEHVKRQTIFSNLVSGYTVSSNKLNSIYCNIPNYPRPTKVIEDGVDLSFFRPINIDRFNYPIKRDIIIGWVGNSKWASETEDFKGVHTILKPAIDQLRSEGFKILPLFADRQDQHIPHEKMPEYYSKIDILVCASKIEGTPNPILEAMSCGVPIISTDVGIVPQVFGPLQQKFILNERSIDELKAKIKMFFDNNILFGEISQENLSAIVEWDWAIKANLFGVYFDELLAKRNEKNDSDI
jgi:glycosyltransferase involved in cell wall biosynthesis/GT2 family glycosyltransferase